MITTRIFGPPGSGKTRTLTDRLAARLAAGCAEDRVAFLTFTRAARQEAAARVRGETPLPWLRTIHSCCYKLLGLREQSMVAGPLLVEFGKSIGVPLTGAPPDPWFALGDEREVGCATPYDELLQAYHLARHRGTPPEQIVSDKIPPHEATDFLHRYNRWRDREGLLDYTDILEDYVARGAAAPVDLIFVDEAQDLSWLQWLAVRRLAAQVSELMIAGDDDQAVYTWAGADPREFFMLRARDEFLERSYRLSRTIAVLAERVVKRIRVRREKIFESRRPDGEVRTVGPLLACVDLAAGALILYRDRFQGLRLAEEMDELCIPFAGEISSLSSGVRRTLAAWRDLCDDHLIDKDAALAIARYLAPDWRPPVPSGPVGTMLRWPQVVRWRPAARNWVEALTGIPRLQWLVRSCRSLNELIDPVVELSTIHHAKGREADHVVVCPDMSRRPYEALTGSSSDDEHRVWYVAVTRARERLTLLAPATNRYYTF
jgi:DNA helicase-2/ATP-dependent DNA helicase PcrA